MRKGSLEMSSWVSEQDIEKTLLPEINRIWKPADIIFVAAAIRQHPALYPDNRTALLSQVVNARRNNQGRTDPKRIKALGKLLAWEKTPSNTIDVYLVPYLGETSQGNAKPKRRRLLVAQWTDKRSKAKRPPRPVLLTEAGEFDRGSLGRILAHELGHAMGLTHPDKAIQKVLHRLMGGRQAGY